MKRYALILTTVFLATAMGIAVSDPCAKPDLVVSGVKVDKSHFHKDGKVDIIYSIKNRGKAVAGPSKVKVDEITSDKTPVIQMNAPGLNPGTIYTNRVSYNVEAGKKYIVKVTADYNNSVSELNEGNNTNTLSFSVGRSF
jgi:subtilase family serine protease